MDALFRLSNKGNHSDLIIATGQSISLLSFAGEVFNYFGLSFENHVEYDSSLLRVGDPSQVHYDAGKAVSVLNWSAASKGIEVPRKLANAFQNAKALHE